jgi:hypothetical protein
MPTTFSFRSPTRLAITLPAAPARTLPTTAVLMATTVMLTREPAPRARRWAGISSDHADAKGVCAS